MKELYDKYDVVGTASSSPNAPVATTMGTERAQVGLIADLIVAVLSADEDSYDQYKTFKLFESFPEVW